ncbi:tRNA (adenosine(37)-N6)-dimethylallyltransferase MiaA [Fuscibacter oryzae]
MSQNGGGFNLSQTTERGFHTPAPPWDIYEQMISSVLNNISREAPVLLAGPTASGKSALAMDLAARDGRVIVNADALQVYANWRILTARPSVEEEAALPHVLYGHVARDQAYSVGEWLRQVAPLLARPVVIVGGTGLYFRALTEGLAEIPPVPASIRAEGDALFAAGGVAALLAGVDGRTAARIDRANGARVQRAWEVLRATGRGLADWQDETPPPLLALGQCDPWVIRPKVEWLDDRIARRFHAMIEAGALAEVQAELPFWNPAHASAKAIGAPELISYLQGESTLSEATFASILASRQYAKRQRTWFRTRMRDWREIALP